MAIVQHDSRVNNPYLEYPYMSYGNTAGTAANSQIVGKNGDYGSH